MLSKQGAWEGKASPSVVEGVITGAPVDRQPPRKRQCRGQAKPIREKREAMSAPDIYKYKNRRLDKLKTIMNELAYMFGGTYTVSTRSV